ncbi:MAG: putative photosynthetic complex assembly protein PuhE [Tardiphaga sp.]
MAPYLIPPLFAAFVWWFSTGAVLLLVGRADRFGALKVAGAAMLLLAGLYFVAVSAGDASTGGAYVAFTGTILLWAAQEIAFLAGWVTGPRAQRCPDDARGLRRLGLALRAILYHETALLACGAAIWALTSDAVNAVALWTFAALWVLRQSAKINLFLGVPVTNDELMPQPVQFLKTFFAKRPVSAFFPLSVTLATAVLVIMIQRLVEVAATPFEIAGLTLVSTLFALGVIEHWFMLLPLPALTLWGWGMPTVSPEDTAMKPTEIKTPPAPPQLVVISGERSDAAPRPMGARQRLEEEFRQRFLELHPRSERVTAIAEPAATINGRTS